MTKTICIDFDGVIHKYSLGWKDGSVYDDVVDKSIEALNALCEEGYAVVIFSTRTPRQIKNYLKGKSNPLIYMSQSDFMDQYYPMVSSDEALIKSEYENKKQLQYKLEVVPFWKKFWNKQNVIGITRRKLPAHCYIDDRAVRFDGEWEETINDIKKFKTYQQW